MRKIEMEMLSAIREGRNWKKDNTEVKEDITETFSFIYLHGNCLGGFSRRTSRFIVYQPTLDKWPTRTTKSRLKALATLNK